MKRWPAAILILILGTFAHAEPHHWFVDASGCFGTIAEESRQTDVHGRESWRIEGWAVSPGAQAVAGVAFGRWSFYSGIQNSSLAFTPGEDYYDDLIPLGGHTIRSWRQSDRFLIGGRLSGSNPNRARALIGIGFSWGWLRRSKTVEYTQNSLTTQQSVHQVSKGSFGLAGELGYLIPVYRDLSLSLIGHLDMINSKIGADELKWMREIDALYLANIQLGLQYHFRRKTSS